MISRPHITTSTPLESCKREAYDYRQQGQGGEIELHTALQECILSPGLGALNVLAASETQYSILDRPGLRVGGAAPLNIILNIAHDRSYVRNMQ